MDPLFSSQEEMAGFIAKARSVIEGAPDQAARLQAVELLSKQMREGMDQIRAANVNAARALPLTGGDAEVVRAYCTPNAGSDDFAPGAVRDIRKGGPGLDATRGHTHVGSGGGVVRMFGSADECGVFEHGLLDDPAPKSEWQKGLQDRLAAIQYLRAIKGPNFDTSKAFRAVNRHLARGPEQIQRVFADNTGEGGEWIVTIPLAQLERTAELQRQLEAALPTMNLSASSHTHPFLTTGVQPFIHGTPSAGDMNPAELPKSVPITGERTVTPKTFTVNVPIDMDASEDAIFDAIAQLNDLIARALVDGFEDALINADSAATHGDTAFATWNPRSRWQTLGSSLDHRRGFIGFRQRAFDVSSTVDLNATQTVSAYIGARAGLTSPHGLGDILYVTSPEHYLAKIILDANVLTVDKYGPSATILTGEVGKIGGQPLLLSEFMTADLASSGLYTGSGALTSMLLINRARFRVARRRNFRVNLTNEYTRNTSWITASERKTLHTFDGGSTKNVRLAINLASS